MQISCSNFSEVRFASTVPALDRHNCKAAVDQFGFHLLTCKLGGSPIWAHDSMVSAWSSCLQNVSVHHKVEPRDQYLHCLNRLDISVFDLSSNANIKLDISLAQPWAKEVLKRIATDCGYAAFN